MPTLSLLLLFFSMMWFGQEPQKAETPPGVVIRKYKGERVGAGPTLDPTFKAENDSPTGTASDSASPPQASGIKDRDTPFFMYSVELQNDGAKSIKAVLWEYLLIDGKTKEELGRHQFVSFEKVARNASKAMTARSRLSPSRIVTVQDSPPTPGSTVVERVVLKCVAFDDGSVWQSAGLAVQSCEPLRKKASN